MLIATRTSRDNRGASIGVAGNHSTQPGSDGIRTPNIVQGTEYLAPLVGKFSKLALKMWDKSGVVTPMYDESLFPG